MKDVKIKSLKLKYFKGIQSLTVEFKDTKNFICGDNATGKTSIFDAFTWLMFGKDSLGQTKFDIKTLDKNNNAIPQVDHEVEGELMIDGRLVTLRKVYREVWGKPRGEAETKLMRDETVCYWDGLEILVGEYNRRVNDIISEDLFKLLTDPAQFFRLKTDGKREVLISMAGKIDQKEIEARRPELRDIIHEVNGRDITDEMKKAAADRKRMQDEAKQIPSRIDTAYSLMPEVMDWEKLELDLAEAQINIKKLDERMYNISIAAAEQTDKLMRRSREIDAKRIEKRDYETACRNEWEKADQARSHEIRTLERELYETQSTIESLTRTIDANARLIEMLNAKNVDLRNKFQDVNKEQLTIDPDTFCCPTCGRDYDETHTHEIEAELKKNFNFTKARRMNEINEEGQRNVKEIKRMKGESMQAMIEREKAEKQKSDIQKQIEQLKDRPAFEFTPEQQTEIKDRELEIDVLTQNFELEKSEAPKVDTADIKESKEILQKQIGMLNQQLAGRTQIERIKAEIDTLTERQRTLAQAIAEIERKEYQIAELGKARLQETERLVNEKFRYIQFRLFKQLKGSDAQELVCDAMVDGVPYDSLNSAARINAGLDVINALSEYHQISAPIFIDNRETVNELLDIRSQIINLVVTKDSILKIN